MLWPTCAASTALFPFMRPPEGSRWIFWQGRGRSGMIYVNRYVAQRVTRALCKKCLTAGACGRFFLRTNQPMYGWWFYFMMSKVGPQLSSFHPKLDVRSCATVDELLACEVRRYVIFCIFCILNIFLHIICIYNIFLHICYQLDSAGNVC